MALLTLRNLSVGYDKDIIVQNLNVTVNAGDYLCILGENGSGKSTLMKTILSLTPPIVGEVIPGEDLSRNEIGYLPQQTPVQKDFPASVFEIVLSGCQKASAFQPFYSNADKETARRNMERMQIADLSSHAYKNLSGGQQQRVLLARALCATKKLLLLDEPVAGLDPKVTNELYDLIQRLNKEDNITIIMISHDIGAAVKYATHILHIGQHIFSGTKEAYVKSETGKLFMTRDVT